MTLVAFPIIERKIPWNGCLAVLWPSAEQVEYKYRGLKIYHYYLYICKYVITIDVFHKACHFVCLNAFKQSYCRVAQNTHFVLHLFLLLLDPKTWRYYRRRTWWRLSPSPITAPHFPWQGRRTGATTIVTPSPPLSCDLESSSLPSLTRQRT